MNIRHCIAPLVCLCFLAAWTWAADLTQVERKIGREPAYASKPQYCLSAFGPNAEARVWLVLDGETLYVDRNANGDLTDDGERVAAKKDAEASVSAGNLQFPAGDLCLGKLTHKNFWVRVSRLDDLAQENEHIKEYLASHPQARGYSVGVEVEMPGRKGGGVDGRVQQMASIGDAQGLLAFADPATSCAWNSRRTVPKS